MGNSIWVVCNFGGSPITWVDHPPLGFFSKKEAQEWINECIAPDPDPGTLKAVEYVPKIG